MECNHVISFSCGEVEENRNSNGTLNVCGDNAVEADSVGVSCCGSVKDSESFLYEGSECSISTSSDCEGQEVNKDPCTNCGQNPCDWLVFEEEICDECEQLVQEKRTNKEVWFHAYRLYTRLRHGVLQKINRRPLPICVRGEIMDNWPDPNHTYVGFQAALRDVAKN